MELRLSVEQLRQLANMIEHAGQDAAVVRLASTDGLTTALTAEIDYLDDEMVGPYGDAPASSPQAMSGYVEHLARELPLCDLGYVRKHHPDALKVAIRYNRARQLVSLEDPATITRARKAKQALVDAIG